MLFIIYLFNPCMNEWMNYHDYFNLEGYEYSILSKSCTVSRLYIIMSYA